MGILRHHRMLLGTADGGPYIYFESRAHKIVAPFAHCRVCTLLTLGRFVYTGLKNCTCDAYHLTINIMFIIALLGMYVFGEFVIIYLSKYENLLLYSTSGTLCVYSLYNI